MRPGHPATLQGFDSYSCGTVCAPDVLPRNVTAVGLSSFKYLRSNAVGQVSGEGVREDLQRDLAAQLRVGGAIHLPHAALADEGGHVIVAETGAWS